MARKSRWQQFADSFNATYGVVTDTAKGLEVGRAMRADYTDDEGNALAGDALDRARYRALSDIYTKYGDVEGGLRVRTGAAGLESAEINNEILRSTKDDLIYQQGQGASALMRARTARAPGAGREPSANELVSAAVVRAWEQLNAEGGAGAIPDDAPVRRVPLAGGLATPQGAPPTASPIASPAVPTATEELSRATPSPGGLATPQVARADLPDTPTLPPSAREALGAPRQDAGPGAGLGVRTAQLDQGGIMSDAPSALGVPQPGDEPGKKPAKGSSPSAQTSAPEGMSAPAAPSSSDVLIRGIRAGKPLGEAASEASAAAREDFGEFLLNVSDQFVAAGRNDLASGVIELYKTHGEIATARILRDSERLKPHMQVALQRGGPAAAAVVLDDYNGPARHISMSPTPDGGVAIMEFELGDDGTPMGQRVLAYGRSEEELSQQLWAHVLDPEARVSYLASVADLNKKRADAAVARVEAQIAEATRDANIARQLLGETPAERRANALRLDPDNQFLLEFVAAETDTDPDRLRAALKDDEDIRAVEAAAGKPDAAGGSGKPDAAGGSGSGQDTPPPGGKPGATGGLSSGGGSSAPPSLDDLTREDWGLDGRPAPPSQADQARERAYAIYRRVLARANRLSSVGPSGNDLDVSIPSPKSPAFAEYMLRVLRADGVLRQLGDNELRALVESFGYKFGK